jgi:hypothetical protein
MGEDRRLLDWGKVVSYFQALAAASPRIRVEELGKSTEGRPFIAATISAPETLRRLEEYRQIQKRLADPRRTPPAEAESLIGHGKAVVLITCSIHSTEVASTSTAVQFAWRMATASDPKTRAILDQVILILVPSLNPDGVDKVTAWYRKTLGTPFEGTAPPELYHKYVGHDNNRDWYIFSQQETRLTIEKLHNRWHPQIVYDVHQMGANQARIFVPPWLDPIEPNVDPILAQWANALGAGMAADLTAAGKKGVVIHAVYDFWTPARHYQAYHGGVRLLSESASARLASPIEVKPDDLDREALGYDTRQRSWNYLEPWLGGWWRVGDIVDYQLIAFESCLFQAAIRRADLLRSFYEIGRRAVARTSPYAFVVPAAQWDPGAAKKLLETLAFGLVEVERARKDFRAAGRDYPAGSYVIRMQQPYSSFAKTLLERQQYPDRRLYPGGPPQRPYDVTAHTLPLLMGVEVAEINEPFAATLQPAREFSFAGNPLSGRNTEAWREINRRWASGLNVWRDWTTGDFATEAGPGRRLMRRPRIGLYRSYQPAMDEGWTRWVLEQFSFPYTNLENRAVLQDALATKFDVIVFPDQREASIHSGFASGSMPEPYVGGLGDQGAAALRAFAESGGTLIFLNQSSAYAINRLKLPVRVATQGLRNTQFYCPGALLRAQLDTAHPLALGLPREIAVWFEGSPVFEAGEGTAVARYPHEDILASGWLLGERYLAGRVALLELPLGRGRVILFGMRPQYRAQSYQTFKLFFNALLAASR